MTDNTEKRPEEPVGDLAPPRVTDEKSGAIRGGFLGGLIKPIEKTVGTAPQSPTRTG